MFRSENSSTFKEHLRNWCNFELYASTIPFNHKNIKYIQYKAAVPKLFFEKNIFCRILFCDFKKLIFNDKKNYKCPRGKQFGNPMYKVIKVFNIK